MAIDQNLPHFDDKTVMNKCHVLKKCHAKLIGVFVRTRTFETNFVFITSQGEKYSLLLHVMMVGTPGTKYGRPGRVYNVHIQLQIVLIHGSIAIAEQREIVDLTCP